MLAGHVENAPSGAQGFDLNRPLSLQEARQFAAKGYRFCVRYLTRSDDQEQRGDLTNQEANDILEAGLALMAVQHVAKAPWVPSAELGTQYGNNAVANARQVGLPSGVNVWLDLEGVASATIADVVVDYCNAWFAIVGGAGYATGIYVGANAILSGDDLYWRLRTKHYWKSGSTVPDIPIRGYQMIQRIVNNDIDRNVTRTDAFGDAVQWIIRA